jgi:hypothetical protein
VLHKHELNQCRLMYTEWGTGCQSMQAVHQRPGVGCSASRPLLVVTVMYCIEADVSGIVAYERCIVDLSRKDLTTLYAASSFFPQQQYSVIAPTYVHVDFPHWCRQLVPGSP